MGLRRLIQGKTVITGTDMAEPPFRSKRDSNAFPGKMGFCSTAVIWVLFKKGLIASSRPQIKQKQLANF